jgi:hypothetical protein
MSQYFGRTWQYVWGIWTYLLRGVGCALRIIGHRRQVVFAREPRCSGLGSSSSAHIFAKSLRQNSFLDNCSQKTVF